MFKTRFGLTDFAGNYTKNNKFKSSNWMCKCGQEKEQESHIIEGKCEAYKDIRANYDTLEDDENLLAYFKEVIERREKLEEEMAGAAPCPPAGGEIPAVLLVPATAGTSRHGGRDAQLVDHL